MAWVGHTEDPCGRGGFCLVLCCLCCLLFMLFMLIFPGAKTAPFCGVVADMSSVISEVSPATCSSDPPAAPPLTCRRLKGLRHVPLPRRSNLSLAAFWEDAAPRLKSPTGEERRPQSATQAAGGGSSP